MDGVVAYVAPNDVVNDEDSAYDRFFAKVGTKECRDRLNGVQREALIRREPLEKKYKEYAAAERLTFTTVGSLDKAYEAVVMDYVWAFWQYSLLADCDDDPGRRQDRHRRGDLGLDRRDLRLLRLHRPGPGARTRRTTTRRAPSSARRTSSSPAPRQPEPLRLPAAAQLRAALTSR